MKILYTGFKGTANSSCRILDHIEGEKLLLTNSFGGLERDIAGVSGDFAAVMFGLDKSLRKDVRIEFCAELNGERLQTVLEYAHLPEAFSAEGFGCTVSGNPTRYLCNAAYFHMLKKTGGRAIFLHIPPLKFLPEERLEAIARAVKKSDFGTRCKHE